MGAASPPMASLLKDGCCGLVRVLGSDATSLEPVQPIVEICYQVSRRGISLCPLCFRGNKSKWAPMSRVAFYRKGNVGRESSSIKYGMVLE